MVDAKVKFPALARTVVQIIKLRLISIPRAQHTTSSRGSDNSIMVRLLETREIDCSVVVQEAFQLDKSA